MSAPLDELLGRANRCYAEAQALEQAGQNPQRAADLRGDTGGWLWQARVHFSSDRAWLNWLVEHFVASEDEVRECLRQSTRLSKEILAGIQATIALLRKAEKERRAGE